jgi:hypothetical protein
MQADANASDQTHASRNKEVNDVAKKMQVRPQTVQQQSKHSLRQFRPNNQPKPVILLDNLLCANNDPNECVDKLAKNLWLISTCLA